MQLMSIKGDTTYFLRIDSEDEDCPPCNYQTELEVIEDATRFYHEHFNMDDDYEDNFEVKDFEQALSFWEANGYLILRAEILNYKGEK